MPAANAWFYPLLRVLFPDQVSTMREVGLPMINSALNGYPKQVPEIKDIKSLAKPWTNHDARTHTVSSSS